MKIVCPQCRTAYDVTPAALGAHGRQVRCVRCKSVWLAEAPKLAPNVVPLAAREPRPAPAPAVAAQEPAPAEVQAEPASPPPAAEEIAAPEAAAAEAPPSEDTAPAPDTTAEAPVAAEPPPEAIEPAAPAAPEAAAEAPAAPAEAAAPLAEAPAAPAVAAADSIDIESVAARRLLARGAAKRPARRKWRLRGLAAAIIGLAVVDGGLILDRANVVRAMPQTASLFAAIGLPVNLRDLAFADIVTKQEMHDGIKILVIEGTIVATGKAVTEVPRLRFSINAANGHEIYAWTALPTRTKLAPGETLVFRTRLASPPEQGRSAKIRFFTRYDLASGQR
jgi:predicted Zn finger-like uncharacterized protein